MHHNQKMTIADQNSTITRLPDDSFISGGTPIEFNRNNNISNQTNNFAAVAQYLDETLHFDSFEIMNSGATTSHHSPFSAAGGSRIQN